MREERVLAMVLAGGRGTRLHPLTIERTKGAVPFGSRYRIVDFVLSNFVNSGVLSIYVLVQYKSQSLIEHVRKAWTGAGYVPGQFVTVMPPQMHEGAASFSGTADAVYQNLHRLAVDQPTLVAVFGADHIYRMDVRQMIDFHRARDAQVTVAALPVPRAAASEFGVIDCDAEGRVRGFVEKPADPPAMPADPAHAFASMGNYLFNADALVAELEVARSRGEKDFGQHVLPRLLGTHRVYAYDFASNRVPGLRPHEEPAYWRDVGAIDAYYAANMDTLGAEPKLHLFNPRWPILSSAYHGPAANVLRGELENSHLGAGSMIRGARVRNSIVRREVLLEEGVELDDSIVMDYCVLRRGARVRRAIIDRYNVIPEGAQIGCDAAGDRARYHRSDAGIAVLPIAPVRGDTNRYE